MGRFRRLALEALEPRRMLAPLVQAAVQRQTLVESSANYAWYPEMHQMPNGTLDLWVQTVPDEEILNDTTPVQERFVSTDQGQTWTDMGAWSFNTHSMLNLSDGSFYGLWYWTICTGTGANAQVMAKAIRSTDGGQTFTTQEDVPLNFSGLDIDPNNLGVGWVCAGQMLQESNGDLYTIVYGFPNDPTSLNVAALIRSTDNGNSWDYVAMVADDAALNPYEGFDEASLVNLGQNRLLATVRTGYTMYQVESGDGGASWSLPAAISPEGVDPTLLQTSDGILACVTGNGHPNPDVFLICSPDGMGQDWEAPIYLLQGPTTGYTGSVQLGPNEFLIAFDNDPGTYNGDPSELNSIYVDLVTIQRSATVGTWTGDGGDGNWSDPANWFAGAIPATGSVLFFSADSPTVLTNDLSPDTSVQSLTFSSGDVTLSGNAVALSGSGPTTISAASGAIGRLDLPLTGNGDVAIQGAGTIWLNGTGSWTGALQVTSGTAIVGSPGSLPDGAGLLVGDEAAFASPVLAGGLAVVAASVATTGSVAAVSAARVVSNVLLPAAQAPRRDSAAALRPAKPSAATGKLSVLPLPYDARMAAAALQLLPTNQDPMDDKLKRRLVDQALARLLTADHLPS